MKITDVKYVIFEWTPPGAGFKGAIGRVLGGKSSVLRMMSGS